MTHTKFDAYQMITDRIVAQLEAGNVPWRKTWVSESGFGQQQNFVTRRPYRGINAVVTAMSGFSSPYWVTFNQAKTLGGSVKKGEKGTPVIYWKLNKYENTDATSGEVTEKRVPFVKYYTVFNLDQTEGIELPVTEPRPEPLPLDERAEAAIAAWKDAPKIFFGGDRAYYNPLNDEVHVPRSQDFESIEAYYATLFHELVHSTGANSRLHRFNPTDGQFIFGSESYSQEELVAEIGSAFVAGRLSIPLDAVNNAAYIRHWLKRLKSDKKFIFTAARDAQQAADRILGEVVADDLAPEVEVAT